MGRPDDSVGCLRRIGPDELLVRVFVGPGAAAQDARAPDRDEVLQAWAAQHENARRRLRRELSLRLPPARLLEFTIDGSDPGSAPGIVMEHDPGQASEPVPPREIVQTAMAVLRSRYVFPDHADQAAAGIEARLVAGEYDELGEPRARRAADQSAVRGLRRPAPARARSARARAPAVLAR